MHSRSHGHTLETFTDARVERYWQLLAVVNGWEPRPAAVPAFEWLIAALRADAAPAPANPVTPTWL